MTHRLRSAPSHSDASQPVQFIPASTDSDINLINPGLTRLSGLSAKDTQILRKKQRRLYTLKTATATESADYGPHAVRALASTLIFAQHEAGTAVCIDPRGWIVTCAHCFGETEVEWRRERYKWLLYYTGLAVQVECRAWDARRDLALAKVIRIESSMPSSSESSAPRFTYVPLSSSSSFNRGQIICIGQPGADDLESSSPQKTDYNLVEISEGRLRGMIPGADPHDNSEIGALKHDAWTYWGHSGAPLLRRVDGTLVGLHSSWDDTTAMRHGIPIVAIRGFLDEKLPKDVIEGRVVEKEVIIIEDSD